MRFQTLFALSLSFLVISISESLCLLADDSPARITVPKRVLLLGQRPDTHPRTTHEYMAGIRLIARYLNDLGKFQVVIEQADNPWNDGPELLDGADGVVLFLTEGAKWVSEKKERHAAFERLAKRGGGLSALHWGLGTREAAPVGDFVSLFGGCHGGPDRKFKDGDFQLVPSSAPHPIISGVTPFEVHDELYYALKFPLQRRGHTALINVRVAQEDYPVAWAWQREDSGRSFGFTGLHYHRNWERIEYRRLIVQGILWTLQDPIPPDGLKFDLLEKEIELKEGNDAKDTR